MITRPSDRFRRISWTAIFALVVVAFVRNAVEPPAPGTTTERVQVIAKTLRCPVCRSQSVADSDVATARAIRTELARRIDAGESDASARDAIAATYGDDLQLLPRRDGIAGMVWTIPVVALALATATLGGAFRRWKRRVAPTVTDADRDLVRRAISNARRTDERHT